MLGGLTALTTSGPVAPGTTITLGLALKHPDVAGEDAYLTQVYDPASPSYRQFLTVTGLQERFGVPRARYDAATGWLAARGLSTTAVPGVTDYVLATGTATAVEAAFATPLTTYSFQGRSFYANTVAPTVPSDLGVLSVVGLQSYTRMRTMQQWQAELPLTPDRPAQTSAVTTGSTTPQDLWGIYNQPSNNTGQGQQMAIFGWGVTNGTGANDLTATLRAFETKYALATTPLAVDHYGPAAEAITDTGGTGEWNLDLPASTGMAPDSAGEHLYFGKSGVDADIIAAYAGWNVDATGPRTGSSSFAGCEASPVTGAQAGGPGNPTTGGGAAMLAIGNPDQDAYEVQLKQTVMLGRTMFVSAGDLGPNGCPYSFLTALNGATTVPTVLNNYPTVSHYVVAVGGTVLYFNKTAGQPSTRFLEYPWNATGGGTSEYVDQPDFQKTYLSAGTLKQPCTTDYHATTVTYPVGTICRGIPDVSAQSGDILTNGYVAGGGTSLSAPLWNGMWARIQAASALPRGLGFADPLIYANNANATRYAADFFDVGGANTATIPADCATGGIPGFNCSGIGWDYLTGWGSPNVTNLMKDLNGGNTTPTLVGAPAAALPETALPAGLLGVGLLTAAGAAVAVRRRRATA